MKETDHTYATGTFKYIAPILIFFVLGAKNKYREMANTRTPNFDSLPYPTPG